MLETTKRKRSSTNEVQRKRQRFNVSPQYSKERPFANRPNHRDQICIRCRSIDFDSIFEMRDRTAPNPKPSSTTVCTLGKIQKSMSDSSCPLCRMFAALCPWKRNSTQQACILKAYSAIRYHFPNTRGKKDIQDTIVLAVAPSNAIQWKPSLARRAGTMYVAEHSKGSQDQRILGNAIDPLCADYEMARGWIQYCRNHHRGYCRSQPSTMVHTVPGFKLIDCQSRKIIRSPQKCEYIALSYVWGCSTSRSSTRTLPKIAPKVIEDAMTVTKKIGFRYLWIDRYCISQIDEVEKHGQIAKMDQIYAAAEVTIVAAAGEGPDHGLPGVSKTPRQTQPSAIVGNYRLVSSLRTPRDVVMSSKWATRAWTFQEAMLSRRVLFFTDEQVLFECASMHCQETVRMPLAAAHQEWSASMGRECDGTRVFPINGPGRFATDILQRVREYTTRNLSYPSDNLNALLGVFNSFNDEQRRYRASAKQLSSQVPNAPGPAKVHHLWGIPILPRNSVGGTKPEKRNLTRRLVLMLGWRCRSPSTRCHDFPSWSWAGWSLPNRVYFPTKTEDGKVHIFNEKPEVKISLRLDQDRIVSCQELEEQLEYDEILREASHLLILECNMVKLSFTRTQDSEFPLKPAIKCKKVAADKESKCNLYFWPNLKLDTELELTRFTDRKWKAIIISSGLVFGGHCTMLVVQKVGKAYERIGIVRGTYENVRFENVSERRIKLQ